MMKDKEWLKEELVKLKKETDERNKYGSNYTDEQLVVRRMRDLADQLDELEITGEQAWDKIAESYPADAKSLAVAFEHFYYEGFAKKKPVIPQFVADLVEKCKEKGLVMYKWFAFDFKDEDDAKIHKWLYDNDYEENTRREYLLIDAIRYGYEVEKEKLYRVRVGKSYVRFNLDGSIVGAKAVDSVVTLDHLSKLPFDYKKAVESGIITLVEITE